MSSSRGQGTEDNLLQSRQSDEFEFGALRSPAVKIDGNDWRLKPPRQAPLELIESFTVDEADLEPDVNSLWNRFHSLTRCFVCRTRSDARLRAGSYMRKPWLSQGIGRRPSISRCIIYLTVGCLSFLSVSLESKPSLSSFRLLTSLVAASFSYVATPGTHLKHYTQTISTGFFTIGAFKATRPRGLRTGRRTPQETSIQSTVTPTTITGDPSRSTQQFTPAVLARKPTSGSPITNYTWDINDMP